MTQIVYSRREMYNNPKDQREMGFLLIWSVFAVIISVWDAVNHLM